MKKLKIKDIAQVRPGFQLTDRSGLTKSGKVAFIQVKDLDRAKGKVSLSNVEFLDTGKDMSKYQIGVNDLLFLAKGNFVAGIIEKSSYGKDKIYIPNGHFYAIKIESESVLPEYLWWYLNQNETRKKFNQMSQGEIMATVRRTDFEDFEVIVPNIANQRFIIELARLRSKEREVIAQLEEEKNKFYDKALLDVAMELNSVKDFDFMEELQRI